ncbi:MAG: AAA family ATPase [Sedimenticolaceae bacterium]
MLTRLEVDGFKNLKGFEADFGPFSCIAGPNGVGKSNIFDAIQFISLLADNSLIEAALKLRGANTENADLRDLFWTDGIERDKELAISAEMIIDQNVKDDFGRPVEASSTFLRYEIVIGLEESSFRGSLGGLILKSEKLSYITEGEAAKRLKFPHSAKTFRRTSVQNRRRARQGYISTERSADGHIEILVHQDGGSSGKPQRSPADAAPRTIIATSNTSATPTILAARREMQRWRILALEPSAMRGADRFQDDPHITPSGDHLPATLFRLANETNSEGDLKVYSRVATRLSDLVSIKKVRVEKDDVRQLLILMVEEKTGIKIPARSLSDGTLRFLTLCILGEDPESEGLICMEEPENGIHPAKMEAMVELLRSLVVDAQEKAGVDNPLRQLIIATHSPLLVQLQKKDDVLFAVEVSIKGNSGRAVDTIRCRPLSKTWRCDERESGVGIGTILSYLTTPPGAQISLLEFGLTK